MIDKKMEPYYNILISIFLGVVLIIAIHCMYDSPRTIVVVSDHENFENLNNNIGRMCHDLNIGD